MTTLQTIPFTAHGEQYEVRITTDGNTIYVRAFKDGKPADGYCLQVTLPVSMDFQVFTGLSAVQLLVEEVQRLVREKAFEGLLKVIAELKAKSGKMHVGP